MKKLLLLFLLVSPAFGQTFAGTAGSDIFIPSPFRFCLGVDGHGDDCATQSANQEMQWTGSVDFKWAFRTVATLPAASALNLGRTYEVTDGQSVTDCTSGGGTALAICTSNGSTWNALAASGGGGGGGGVPNTLPNCTATGTTLNSGVSFSTQVVNSVTTLCAQTAAVSSNVVVGIATSGAGTSGSVAIAYSGYANCIFDNQTTQGDYVIASTTNAGQCSDIGAGKPGGTVEVIGIVASTNSGGGTLANVLVNPLSLYTPGGTNNSGNINTAAQFKVPYYSASGNQNVLSGDSNCTLTSGFLTGCLGITIGSGGTTGAITLGNGTAPSTPPAGNSVIYTDGSGNFQCKNSSGGSCASTSSAFNAITSGTNTAATMTVGTGASLGTSGTGSIQATGLPSATVSTLPTNLPSHTVYEVTDGVTTGDCTSGGGVQNALCVWNGANWSPIGDGGGVSTLPGTVNLGLSYNMSCATVYGNGSQTTTNGVVNSGSTSILLTSATGFSKGQNVFIVGAGTSSGPFNALITNVSSNTITVNVATGTTVTGAAVYNYSAPAQTTTNGTVNSSSTSIPVNSVSTFFANQGINIAGAGAAGGAYIGTIQSVNIGGSSITVTPATTTTVSNAIVEHDESASLNAAITGLAGGQVNGTLYAPAGICLFNGPLLRTGDANAIIPLPNVPYDVPGDFSGVNGPTLSITIQGATVPSWTNYLISSASGWTTIPTSVGTVFQTSAAAGNFIGANNPNESDQFTAVHLTLKNLVFRAPDNPAITMVNAGHAIGLDVQDSLFDTLTNGAQAAASQPTHTNGQAIVVPLPANDGQNQLLNIRVSGYYTATTWGEHSIGNHLTLYGNWQGILCQDNTGPPSGTHRSWAGYVDIAATPYAIVGGSTNKCYVYIEALDPELNLVPAWASGATNRAMVYDPNNLLTGYIGIVDRTWFTRYGGNNIEVKFRDTAPNAAGNLTWVPGFIGNFSPVQITSLNMTQYVTTQCDTPTINLTFVPSAANASGYGCVTTGVNITGKNVTMRVPSVLQSNTNLYTLFEIGNDPNNLLELYVNNGTITFKKRVGGTFTTIASGTYNPSTMLWWQITESSGTIVANTSPDGINWTALGTCSATCVSWAYTSTNMSFEVDCITSCPTYAGRATFDNFGLSLSAPTYPRSIVTDGLFGSSTFSEASACETSFGTTTLNTGAATTDTGNTCLPANAVIDAVVYRITTTITTSASFTIGDATTAARFCSTQSTLTSGTTGVCFVQADQTGAPGPRQASAAKVRVTLNANPGAGAIRLIVYYHTWTAPTS